MNASVQQEGPKPQDVPTIIIKATGITYAIICFYVFVMLTMFEIKQYWGKDKATRKLEFSGAKKSGIAMRVLCILAAAATCLRFAVKTTATYRPDITLGTCRFIFYLGLLLIMIPSLLVYGALFIRQDSLHKNPSLKHLKAFHHAGLFGKLVFVSFIIAHLIFQLIYFTLAEVGLDEHNYCTILKMHIPVSIPPILLLVGMCITESCLLLLFIIPLIKHYRTSKTKQRTSRKFFLLIVRSFLITSVCVVTDIFSYTWVVVGYNKFTIPILLNTSILVNTLSIVFTFADWRQRVFPCLDRYFAKKKKKKTVKRQKNNNKSEGSSQEDKSVFRTSTASASGKEETDMSDV